MFQTKAKDFAARHGYTVRKVPHSAANPNGYIKVITPDGSEYRAIDWSQARQMLMGMVFGKQKRK